MEVYELAVQLYQALVAYRRVSRGETLSIGSIGWEPFNRLSEFIANLPAILDQKGIR